MRVRRTSQVIDTLVIIGVGLIGGSLARALRRSGAVGEIVGWVFDRDGRLIDCGLNERVASAVIPSLEASDVVAVAMGPGKTPAIAAAMRGRLVNGLITDEATAARLLAEGA